MKPKEIRAKSDAELQEEAARLRRERYHLKVQSATGALENPARLGANRRAVARILTVLGERRRLAKVKQG